MRISQKFIVSLFSILMAFQTNNVMAGQSVPPANTQESFSKSPIFTGNQIIFFASSDKKIDNKLKQAFNSSNFETAIKGIYHEQKNTFKLNEQFNFVPILLVSPQENFKLSMIISDEEHNIVMKAKSMIKSLPNQKSDRIEMTVIPFMPEVIIKPGTYYLRMTVVKNNIVCDYVKYTFTVF